MGNYAESHFLRLQDYIAEGSHGDLSPDERDYENLLFSTAGLVRKEGREAAIRWLTEDRGCSRFVAHRVYEESVNLFYASDGIREQAWRNVLFQKLMDAARLWEQHFMPDPDREQADSDDDRRHRRPPTAKDFEAYAKMLGTAAKVRRLDQADPEQHAPMTQNNLQVNLYGTDAQAVGMPATDRRRILDNPYFKNLRKRDQKRLAMEAGLVPMDIDEILDTSVELANEVTGEE